MPSVAGIGSFGESALPCKCGASGGLLLEGRCRAKCNLLKRLIAVQDTALHPDPFIPSGWIVPISGTRRSCAEKSYCRADFFHLFFHWNNRFDGGQDFQIFSEPNWQIFLSFWIKHWDVLDQRFLAHSGAEAILNFIQLCAAFQIKSFFKIFKIKLLSINFKFGYFNLSSRFSH